MQVGIAGLGRMGAGMARRLARAGHQVVAWNRTEQVAIDVAAEPENGGHVAVAEPLETHRREAGGPAARRHQRAVRRGHRRPDRSAGRDPLAGGRDRGCRQLQLPRLAAPRRRAGGARAWTGWTWGSAAASGGCRSASAPWSAASARSSIASSRRSAILAPEGGYLYCGPAGAGHYVKMVHNGIEYGIMQAYGEGFDILHASDYDLDLAAIARMWQQRVGDPLLAARAGGRRLHARGQRPGPRSRAGSPTPARAAGRWPRRSTTTCPRPIITLSLIAALPQPARAGQLHRSGPGRAAQRVRRARGEVVGRRTD